MEQEHKENLCYYTLFLYSKALLEMGNLYNISHEFDSRDIKLKEAELIDKLFEQQESPASPLTSNADILGLALAITSPPLGKSFSSTYSHMLESSPFSKTRDQTSFDTLLSDFYALGFYRSVVRPQFENKEITHLQLESIGLHLRNNDMETVFWSDSEQAELQYLPNDGMLVLPHLGYRCRWLSSVHYFEAMGVTWRIVKGLPEHMESQLQIILNEFLESPHVGEMKRLQMEGTTSFFVVIAYSSILQKSNFFVFTKHYCGSSPYYCLYAYDPIKGLFWRHEVEFVEKLPDYHSEEEQIDYKDIHKAIESSASWFKNGPVCATGNIPLISRCHTQDWFDSIIFNKSIPSIIQPEEVWTEERKNIVLQRLQFTLALLRLNPQVSFIIYPSEHFFCCVVFDERTLSPGNPTHIYVW